MISLDLKIVLRKCMIHLWKPSNLLLSTRATYSRAVRGWLVFSSATSVHFFLTLISVVCKMKSAFQSLFQRSHLRLMLYRLMKVFQFLANVQSLKNNQKKQNLSSWKFLCYLTIWHPWIWLRCLYLPHVSILM